MANQYITCYPLQFVSTLSDTIAMDCNYLLSQPIPAQSRHLITLKLTADEVTRVFSALKTGADLIYPEQPHYVTWLYWRALDYAFQRVLFADDFRADEVAPIASPRVDVPKADSVITQLNAGAFKVLSQEIVVSSVTTTSAAGDLEQETADTYERCAGLAMLISFRRPTIGTGDVRIGFSDSGDTLRRGATFRANNSQIRAYANLVQVNQVATLVANVQYDMAIVFQQNRVFYFFRGGIYTDWSLLWVSRAWTSTSGILASHMHLVPRIDDALSRFRVVSLGGRFVAENAIADYNDITLVASDRIEVRSNFVALFDVGVISATSKIITVRTQDSSNNWRITMNTTSTELHEVVAGIATLRGSGVALASNDIAALYAFGNTIEFHAANVRFFNYNSASSFNTETTLVHSSGADILTFSAYPRVLDIVDSQELSLA